MYLVIFWVKFRPKFHFFLRDFPSTANSPPPQGLPLFLLRKPQVASFEGGRGWEEYKFFFGGGGGNFFWKIVLGGKSLQKIFEIPKPQVASFEELESGNPWGGGVCCTPYVMAENVQKQTK